MAGLTISTDAISPRTLNAPAPSTSAAAPTTAAPTTGAPAAAASSSAAGATNPLAQTPPRSSRSSSPARPPISPITPTLPPARLADPSAPFAADRPVLTHSSQPPTAAASAVPPPPPEPIDFESNPDVLALKSAISILQLQQKKAAADIKTLSRAKNAAIDDPAAFAAALEAGAVRTQVDPLFLGSGADTDSDDDDAEDEKSKDAPPPSDMGVKTENKSGKAREQPLQWGTLPRPQNVVRCPPINWSQYAVVGDSLDRLHADQIARPSHGAPATLGPNGAYEFTGVPGGNQRPYIGVAAPYTPGKDRIDKKVKGGKR